MTVTRTRPRAIVARSIAPATNSACTHGTRTNSYSKLAVDSGVPLTAIATHASPGGRFALPNPSIVSVPTFFSVLENDIAITGAGSINHRPDLIDGLFQDVVKNGLEAEYHIGLEKMLNPLRFTRIPGVTTALAQEVFDLLIADGVIDANGLRLMDLAVLNDYSPGLTGLTSTPGPGFSRPFFNDEVSRQLKVVWARHAVSSEFVDEHVAFFLSHLAELWPGDVNNDGLVNFLDITPSSTRNPQKAMKTHSSCSRLTAVSSVPTSTCMVPSTSSTSRRTSTCSIRWAPRRCLSRQRWRSWL